MSMFVITDAFVEQSRGKAGPPATAPETSTYETCKLVLDFALALVLLILTAPIVLFAMILIKLTSPGPAIYTQTRLGKNGQPFTIYKLRTMANNCESPTGAQWSVPGDARVTALGRWLRKTHIDELPQLWNVLRGDMSLIGPRPERPEFTPALEQAIPLYRERLKVRPGVTGFAQVQLPADTDFDSVRIKLAYDLYYVGAMGIWFDIKIYLGTLFKVVGMPLKAIGKLCLFPPRDEIENAYEDRLSSPER
jgi:lipopolysaccharide/colanic/teichoic acid biosynthesis glycosyltransferase